MPNTFAPAIFAPERVTGRTNHRIRPDAFLWQWLGNALIDRARLIKPSFGNVQVIAPTPLFATHLQAARPDWTVTHTAVMPRACDAIIMLGLPTITNDVPRLLADCHAALAPNGVFLAGFFGGGSFAELRTALLHAESALCNGAASRVAPMIDANSVAHLLQRAGFALPVVDHEDTRLTYAQFHGLIDDLRAANTTAVLHSVQPMPRALAGATATAYRQSFADPRGRLVATLHGLFLSGWKA